MTQYTGDLPFNGTNNEQEQTNWRGTPPLDATLSLTNTHKSPFQFHGNGKEYFGIWIVNLCLTIVTLGIYSAWAKVRNQQYFYGNTELEGATFEYTADPLKILAGRIIASVFFALYVFAENFSLVWALAATGAFFVFMPWAIRQSLRFNARFSLYRNIPFVFRGSLGGAYKAFLLWPILGVITVGILMPFAIYQQQKYIVGQHQFGTSPFTFTARPGEFYALFGILLGVTVGWIALLAVGFVVLQTLGMVLMVPVWLGGYLLLFAIFNVQMANITYGSSYVGQHSFAPNWRVGSYFKLLFTNTLFTLLTLGLFIPWAKVRSAKYAAEHTDAVVFGDLDEFISEQDEKVSTLGEGIGDLFDLDVGV
ncbi:YjgN family protein [Salinispirillum marinum]|uniref:YjgN family protein n=2 Tax=Saccharospirillaceae TaxID=255527 RepID=A0ABV8BFT8_9GAMM